MIKTIKMAKKKELASLDTPIRRSKRLMKLKADDQPEEFHQQPDAPSSSTDLSPSKIAYGKSDDAAAGDGDDNLETLVKHVFKNMKSLLVNSPEDASKPTSSVEQQSKLLLETVKTPCKKIQIDFHHPATKLQLNMKETPYFSFRQADIVASHVNKTKNIVGDNDNEILSKSVITKDFETKSEAPPMRITKIQKRKFRKMQADRSAGKEWFDLPATTITPELKNDLRILKMRGALDPSRHYKKNDTKELPKYFQVGTVIEGPGEFYSARIPKKSRQPTIVDELLADDKFRRYHKKKYEQLQHKFQRRKNIKFKRRFKKKSFLKF